MKPPEYSPEQVCPFLGVTDDANTHLAFASPYNCCHCPKSGSVSVKLEHQAEYCLTASHGSCQVYIAGTDKAFPRELEYRPVAAIVPWYSSRTAWIAIGIIVALILIGAAYWVLSERSWGAAPVTSSTPDPTSTPIFNAAPTATEVPLLPSTSTPPQPTATLRIPSILFPVMTTTPGRVAFRSLDTPLGSSDQQFMIHQVKRGENLALLATRYRTSAEAILHVTNGLTSPVWVGVVVVIPLNQPDPTGLPVFDPYLVREQRMTMEDAAVILGVDASLFKFYNNFSDGEVLLQGEWILLPRPANSAPTRVGYP